MACSEVFLVLASSADVCHFNGVVVCSLAVGPTHYFWMLYIFSPFLCVLYIMVYSVHNF